MCLTLEKAIDNEVATKDIPEEDQIMMVVCEKGNVKSVRYLPFGLIPAECLLLIANTPFPNLSMNHVSTGVEDLLFPICYPAAAAAGKPNILSSGSHGLCPHCMLPSQVACKYPITEEIE